jgi:hypothetical protein
MRIYIPSKGRADRVAYTLGQISKDWREVTQIVVPEGEVEDYEEFNPGWDVRGTKKVGIGPVRQEIIDIGAEDGKVFMVDDDLKFSRRRKEIRLTSEKKWVDTDGLGIYEPTFENPRQTDEMFNLMDDWLSIVPAVGIAMRQMNNGIEDRWYREATRMNNVYGFDVNVLKAEGIRFDAIPVMEDFWVTLKLLTRGYTNRVSVDWVWNQRGSGFVGGCSSYRTPEVQAAAAHALHAEFPDFVAIREKTCSDSNPIWKGMKTRTDVTIQWRKAYASAPERDSD